MPLNRFSTVGQSEYTPQHVPLPFEAIAALGEKTQKTYDAAIDDTYKLKDLMTKVPAIHDPNLGLSNIKKKQELDAQFAPKIDELTNKIMAGDPNAPRELEQVKRDFVNNPIRQELENSYVDYKAYKEDRTKKGDKYAAWEDPYVNQQLVDANTGELKPFRYSGMGEVQDHQKLSDEMMKGFVESSNEFKTARLGADGIIRTNFGKGAAITDKQIRNAANAKINDFINNKEGISFLKQMKFQYPDATPEQLQQAVSDKLYHSGMNQIHNNSGGGNIIDVTSMANDISEKLAQIASTTPETLTLRDNGSLKTMMPEGLSKFYDNNDINLSNNVQAGSKQQGDEVAKMGGWINLELGDSKKSNNLQKNAIEYTNQLFENASKILGISKKEVAERYKKEDNGYKWLKGTVENHYQNLTLEKNNVATLQAPEQIAATNFFLGGNPSEKESPDAIAPNIRSAELTDLQGNRIDNKKGINSNNYNVSSIGFDKPGQIVLSGSNGTQLLMNTNYPTFNKVTQPMVDINNGATNYLKTFELNKDQKSRLGIADNISNKAPEFSTILNDQPIKGEAIDWHKYKLNNKQYDVITFNTRAITGNPEIYVNYKVKDNNGNVIDMKTLSLDQYKILTANSIIQSPEFRSINKEHENKVEFNTK